MKKLPLKMRVIQLLSTVSDLTVEEVKVSLESEYGSEKQFNSKNLANMFLAMKAVGIVSIHGIEPNGETEISVRYSLTDYGRSTMTYIPV